MYFKKTFLHLGVKHLEILLHEGLPARPDHDSKILVGQEQYLGTGQRAEQAVHAGVARGRGFQVLVEQLVETKTKTLLIKKWVLGHQDLYLLE